MSMKNCLKEKLSNTPRFTKETFVREKNTQKLETAYLIQLLSLNMNMDLLFECKQRPQNGGHFSF